jgi:hypothetical protein
LLDVEEGDAGIVRHGQVQDRRAVDQRDDVVVAGDALHRGPGADEGVAGEQLEVAHQTQPAARILQRDGQTGRAVGVVRHSGAGQRRPLDGLPVYGEVAHRRGLRFPAGQVRMADLPMELMVAPQHAAAQLALFKLPNTRHKIFLDLP